MTGVVPRPDRLYRHTRGADRRRQMTSSTSIKSSSLRGAITLTPKYPLVKDKSPLRPLWSIRCCITQLYSISGYPYPDWTYLCLGLSEFCPTLHNGTGDENNLTASLMPIGIIGQRSITYVTMQQGLTIHQRDEKSVGIPTRVYVTAESGLL